MKTAVKAKIVEVAKNPQESFLVDIARVFRRSQKIHGKPEHTLVVGRHELFKCGMIPGLSSPDQRRLVHLNARSDGHGSGSTFPVRHSIKTSVREKRQGFQGWRNTNRAISVVFQAISTAIRFASGSRLKILKLRI